MSILTSKQRSVGDSPFVTLLVRSLAVSLGVDLLTVRGTGAGGRIRKQDVITTSTRRWKNMVGDSGLLVMELDATKMLDKTHTNESPTALERVVEVLRDAALCCRDQVIGEGLAHAELFDGMSVSAVEANSILITAPPLGVNSSLALSMGCPSRQLKVVLLDSGEEIFTPKSIAFLSLRYRLDSISENSAQILLQDLGRRLQT